jgi:hypothetical protein
MVEKALVFEDLPPTDSSIFMGNNKVAIFVDWLSILLKSTATSLSTVGNQE